MRDLRPATERLAGLVQGVADDQLSRPTPCAGLTVGDLVDHLACLAVSFSAAAQKVVEPGAREGDACQLAPDWRTTVPTALVGLGAAWDEPEAWTGMTWSSGSELPAAISGLVAFNEMVLHGWDLAVATGQPYEPADDELEAVLRFFDGFADDERATFFGPAVSTDPSAALLARTIAASGRNPGWTGR